MFKNHLILFGALIFSMSLSLTAKAEVVCDEDGKALQKQLGSKAEAACTKVIDANGKQVKVKVSVKKKKVTKAAEVMWGEEADPNKKTVETEVAEVDIQTETECFEGCAEGVRRGNPVRHSIDREFARELDKIVREKYVAAAEELTAQSKEENERKARIEQCLINEQGAELSKTEQVQCRINRFGSMNAEQREAYYDSFMKADLTQRLGSSDTNVRNGAMVDLVETSRYVRGNAYLERSVKELHEYGKAHQLGHKIIEALQRNPQDPLRFQYFQAWNNARAGFTQRGQQMNTELAQTLTAMEMQNLTQDYLDYQNGLADLNSKIPAQLPANPTTGTTAPGRVQNGQPMNPNGTVVTAPGPLKPGQPTQKPSAQNGGRNANGMPVIGANPSGAGRPTTPGARR